MAWTKWLIAGATAIALLGGCRSDEAGIGGSGEEQQGEEMEGHEDHVVPGQPYESPDSSAAPDRPRHPKE